MGQAITYTYPLWPRMKNYLKDGNLKIDNNLAENAIRPLTLSRKNFLFCGNHEAAENTAIICSLLATCKAQEINPREWLNDVIAKLPYYPEKDFGKNVRELFPEVWKLEKSNRIQLEFFIYEKYNVYFIGCLQIINPMDYLKSGIRSKPCENNFRLSHLYNFHLHT